MGLNSAMWSGVSGLLAHSEQMAVISNNLANVSTVGFKSARMDFEDMLYANTPTSSGMGQVGMGVKSEIIKTDYSQGSLQNTNSSTDMAISGNGFFTVADPNSNSTYYTRAGNFNFNSDGYLVDPHGYRVQGWKVDNDRQDSDAASGITESQVPISGALTDVAVSQFSIKAKPTSSVSMITNLDSTATAHTVSSSGNPYFSMFENYNSANSPALPTTDYEYSTTINAYDTAGGKHKLTVYYDKVASNTSSTALGGKSVWQYMVCCSPSEDGRTIGGQKMSSSAQGGVLMIGTMTFDTYGDLENMTAFTLNSTATPTGGSFGLDQWTQATTSNTGYPQFTANFKSASNANATDQSSAVNISMNFGVKNAGSGYTAGTAANASLVGSGAGALASIGGFASASLNTTHSTSYASSDSTTYQKQNGYPSGTLQSVSVDENGVLTGKFSNGQSKDLYVIGLTNFTNPWGLKREGGNLFSETRDSGDATTNRPNTQGLGSITGSALETSNVDMSTELVQMITTQRGFEANSKTITTADTMLSQVIQLKR